MKLSRARLLPLVPYAVPTLVVLVACAQIYLAHDDGRLTPGKGGGFGLFSTVDKLNNRQFRSDRLGEGFRAPITVIPARLFYEIEAARAFPTASRLEGIAAQLLEEPFDRPVEAIQIQVWKLEFDAQELSLRRRLVAEYLLPRNP